METIGEVDCLILNDAEIRQLTERAQPGPRRARGAARWARGVVVAKRGEYGAALFTAEGFFALPAFPLETVLDPTGAGDSFAGGFIGYIAGHRRPGARATRCCRRAMAYGTALASFNVEEFGTERVARLTSEEIDERVAELRRMTRFVDTPVALRERYGRLRATR